MPARHHLAVRAEAVPLVVDLGPFVDNAFSAVKEIVPGVADLPPSGSHNAARLKIIIDVLPAR